MTAEDALKVHLAEYTALRAEICAFHSVEGQVMAVSIGLISALSALFGYSLGQSALSLEYARHLVPLPFVALGVIFAYTQSRIVQSAAYIQGPLRRQIVAAGGNADALLDWERYRRADAPVRVLAMWLNSGRWLFFVVPSLFPFLFPSDIKTTQDVILVILDVLFPAGLVILALWSSLSLPSRVMNPR